MKSGCLACGAEMVATRETRRYGRGLNVVLEDVQVFRCPACGEEEIEIPNVEGLHEVIARELAVKQQRLTPTEIRWLRTYLGYSGADFAKVMGVTPETVSRWERVDAPKRMQLPAEKLLRVMALHDKPASDYGLLEMGSKEPEPAALLHVRAEGGRWAHEAA